MKSITDKILNLTTEDYQSILIVVVVIIFLILRSTYKKQLWKRKRKDRRDYYRNVYLKSDAWQRKRFVVLRRDNWRCVHCGSKATQVHHKRYARINIGKEPIKWLESVCKPCHKEIHS
ncbi:HNH endonuclease [Psychroserpens jangbogonensis]|uniref:HNH endonuclease n=1 Tax=Psychroserpens jangbogonensis TaxID=1484460 RepID=UPI00053DC8DE|nr:hypothetical protein [Psychroserpens jangbogonensis]